MKIYIYDNKEYEEIPYWLWPDTSPITEVWFIDHGGLVEDRPDPPAPEAKDFSKLQILLYFKKDLFVLQLKKSLDKVFLKALEDLDYFNFWDAAEYISSEYEDYEAIVAAVKEKTFELSLEEHVAYWKEQGYTEEAITDMSLQLQSTFERCWSKALEDIKKYGEA